MKTISRRGLILGCVGAATLAVVFPRPAAAQATITVEEFRALSARLTGTGMSGLNVVSAGDLLGGFLSMGHGPDLARLAADPGAREGPLADDIVAAWYSGRYDTRNGLATIGLANALLWTALDFTKPPGLCGGATGYWADAPQN
jgi:hypothetical protein